MAQDGSRRFNWAGLPPIATVARLLCRELTLQNEYLRVEKFGASSEDALSSWTGSGWPTSRWPWLPVAAAA